MSLYDRPTPSRYAPVRHDSAKLTSSRAHAYADYSGSGRAEGQADFIDLQDYLLVLRRRWLPALLIFLTLPSLAAVYVLMKVPVYEAEGRLLVEVDRRC